MPDDGNLSDDAALGGRLRLWQPRRGHRFGHDAILLAAAVAAGDGDVVADLGAGVGAAGLALAARVAGVRVKLIEIDPALAAIAAENARRNGLADRVEAIALDVGAPPEAFARAGLAAASCAAILMNPPFHDPARHQPSPQPQRRRAHCLPQDAGLDTWFGTASRLLRRAGTLTAIFRADALDRLIVALGPAFGAITVMPVHPKPDQDAIRVIVRAVKGSGAPLAIAPGLVLADAEGRPTAAAQAVLRDGEALALGAPAKRGA